MDDTIEVSNLPLTSWIFKTVAFFILTSIWCGSSKSKRSPFYFLRVCSYGFVDSDWMNCARFSP